MTSQTDPLDVPFDADQVNALRQMIVDAGATVDSKGIISLNGTVKSEIGLWLGIYQWIAAQIASSGLSSPDISSIEYWFSKAPAINGNLTSDPSVQYIRGDTRYGLLFNNKIENVAETATQDGLQTTSNLIGQNVVGQILRDGGIPSFATMLSGDISAAIGSGVSPLWQQTIGGWGGTFYYWSTPLTPRVTVGNATLNGNSQGTGPLQTQPSITEFYYDNANAAADFAKSEVITLLQGSAQAATLAALFPGLGPASVLLSPALRKAMADGFAFAGAAKLDSPGPRQG